MPIPDAPAGDDAYRVESAYEDSSWRGSLAFGHDPALVLGPDPEDVSNVTFAGDLDLTDSAVPGSAVTLQVRVADSDGRSWLLGMEGAGSHAANEYPLPPSRVQVSVSNASYNPAERAVTFGGHDNPEMMVGETYDFQVAYVGSEAAARRSLRPDFLGLVPFMSTDRLTFAGGPGRTGQRGRVGARGRDGHEGNTFAGACRAGSGAFGSDGQNGGTGGPGPNIRITAREAHTLDGRVQLVLFQVEPETSSGEGLFDALLDIAIGIDSSVEHYVRVVDGPPLTVISRGGNGGNGGQGGTGGRGGDGRDGDAELPSCDGGQGGNGGDGGDGGIGGDGGTVTLITADGALEQAFTMYSEGGPGGRPGAAGRPGSGGDGGIFRAEDGDGEVQVDAGADGATGREGNPGQAGRAGSGDAVRVSIRSDAAHVVPPPELRRLLRF